MNYYSHHIGDFNAATRHLDFMERAIYKELIELQYDLETPIPDDINWIMKRACIPNERSTDVERMLNEFFDLVEQGWSNARCEHEVEAYQAKREAAVKAGKASGKARRRNKKPNKNNKKEQKGTNVERTLNERCDSVEPTNNQEPLTNNQDKGETPPPKNLNLNAWQDYIAHRKDIKAKKLQPKSILKQQEFLAKQGDAKIQQEIVDTTIRNNWTGLFELKNKKPGSNKTQDSEDPPKWWTMPDHDVLDWANQLGVSTYGKQSQQLQKELDQAWRQQNANA